MEGELGDAIDQSGVSGRLSATEGETGIAAEILGLRCKEGKIESAR